MSGRKKILFVINPASGHKKVKPGEKDIERYFRNSDFLPAIIYTEKSGHAYELAYRAVSEKYDAVVAVGGDGTVNEVARALNNTYTALGIIPCGSGNGLARHHHISMNVGKALAVIRNFKTVAHDSVQVNEHISFNVSGIGFDAHVAHLFGKDGRRGFNNYLRLVFREFPGYKPHHISIKSGGKVTVCPSTMLAAIANGTQFGNNARISPHSDTNDGLADIIAVKRMQGWKMPFFAMNVFRGKVQKSRYATILQSSEALLKCDELLPLHIDGEPAGYASEFKIKSIYSSLKLIIP